MADIEQRVAAGAVLLDQERPGWWKEVDDDELDMSSYTRDLLGQVCGHYREAVVFLHGAFDIQWVRDHGFTVGSIEEPWATLDRLWLAAIAERRARAESVGPTAEGWAAQR